MFTEKDIGRKYVRKDINNRIYVLTDVEYAKNRYWYSFKSYIKHNEDGKFWFNVIEDGQTWFLKGLIPLESTQQQEIYTIDDTQSTDVEKANCISNKNLLGEKINTETNMTNKIITFVKELALSEDEKLLRKHNLKTECGEYTSTALDIIIRKLTQENEAYLVETLKKMEAESKDK